MTEAIYKTTQHVLKNPFGKFYYEAKYGNGVTAKELASKFETSVSDLSLLSVEKFISEIEELPTKKEDPNRFTLLIKKIKRLARGTPRGIVEISDHLFSLRSLLEIEELYKRHIHKVYETLKQKFDRNKKRKLRDYLDAIKKVQELDNGFDANRYIDLAENRVREMKASDLLPEKDAIALGQIEHMQHYGYMPGLSLNVRVVDSSERDPWKSGPRYLRRNSAKGHEVLTIFLREVHRIAHKVEGLTDSKIATLIAELLSGQVLAIAPLLDKSRDYSRDDIRGYMKREAEREIKASSRKPARRTPPKIS